MSLSYRSSLVARRRDRGIALMLVLLVLTILIVLVSQLVMATSHSRSVADSAVGDLQNSYGVKSAYAVAVQYLLADGEKAPEVDTLNEGWAGTLPVSLSAASVTVKIEDTERKVNLALMVKDNGEQDATIVKQVRRLLTVLHHDPTTADRLLDYQDKNLTGDYETGAKNDRMFNLDELMRVEGLPPEALFGDDMRKGILSFVTVWPRATGAPQQGQPPSTAGKININTAPVEVLQALDDEMTGTLAQAIVDHRAKQTGPGTWSHFTKSQELIDVQGMTTKILAAVVSQVDVKAGAFEIHAKSTAGSVEKKWLYVVTRGSTSAAPGPSPSPSGTPTGSPTGSPSPSPSGGGGSASGITLIAAVPESDFLSIKPPKKKDE